MLLRYSRLRGGTQNLIRIRSRLLHSDVDHLAVPCPRLRDNPDEKGQQQTGDDNDLPFRDVVPNARGYVSNRPSGRCW